MVQRFVRRCTQYYSCSIPHLIPQLTAPFFCSHIRAGIAQYQLIEKCSRLWLVFEVLGRLVMTNSVCVLHAAAMHSGHLYVHPVLDPLDSRPSTLDPRTLALPSHLHSHRHGQLSATLVRPNDGLDNTLYALNTHHAMSYMSICCTRPPTTIKDSRAHSYNP
ncbi:hypothetical protein BR93DRAFT_726527 [Coniochaeta sp. PMI_546]|nr:hypothetical protein BR93DRAFT_726527 [Coniochaeta sp. PMI_546]